MITLPQEVQNYLSELRHSWTLFVWIVSDTEVQLRFGLAPVVSWHMHPPLPQDPLSRITLIDAMIVLISTGLQEGLYARLDNVYHITGMQHLPNMYCALRAQECSDKGLAQELVQPWKVQLQILNKS